MNDKDVQNPPSSAELASEPVSVAGESLAHGESAPAAALSDTVALQEAPATPADAAVPSGFQLPGPLLAARREQLRWSLDEAALRLKLTPRQVSALEGDDYASLPGMASVRGFVRSYAKALGLDPQPLLDMLANEPNPAQGPVVLRRPLPSNGFPGRRSAPPPRRSKWRRRLAIAVLLLAVLAGVGYEGHRSQWLVLPSLDDLDLHVEFTLPGLDFLDSSPPEAAAKAPVEEPAKAEPAVVAPAPRMPVLELKLQEDAWVEVTTLEGEKIVSRLMKGGTAESVEINQAVVLVVGNAAAVEARFRGQPLNLKAVARDNVSKLSLK